jgi:calmodulin
MMVKKMQESDTENEVREAYRVFDKERTGYIEAAELKMIFAALPQKLSDREIDEMLCAADEDGKKDIAGGFADTSLSLSKISLFTLRGLKAQV